MNKNAGILFYALEHRQQQQQLEKSANALTFEI